MSGLKKSAIAIESSTLYLSYITELTEAFRVQHIDFIDAPVVGSRPQADAGSLIFLAGGNEAVLDRARPALSCMSSAIHHAGPNTTGTRMKLAVNAYFGIQVAALSEIIGLLDKSNIAKDRAIELFNQLPVTSPALQGIGHLIMNNQFDPLFPIRLVEKDFRYAVNMSKSYRSEAPLANAALGVYKKALKKGLDEKNINSIIQLYE